jgi:hypothetical protein
MITPAKLVRLLILNFLSLKDISAGEVATNGNDVNNLKVVLVA